VAGSNGRGETVALLLAAGANPNSANTNGLEAKDDINNNEKIREIYNQFEKVIISLLFLFLLFSPAFDIIRSLF
jgi:ankyrin repeat protein